MTFPQAAAQLSHLLPFNQQIVTQLNAAYDSNWTGVFDSLGYPTNSTVETLVPLLTFSSLLYGVQQITTYISLKYIGDACRLILGLTIPPTLTSI